MVRIVSLAGLGRRVAAAVPALAIATTGAALVGTLASSATGLHVPGHALTDGASPPYPAAGDAPPSMQLPPIYDTFTTDPAGVAVPLPAREAINRLLPVRLDAHGIPAPALAAYRRAADLLGRADAACGLDWALLAAIGRVESNHARYGGNGLDTNGVARPGIFGVPLDGRRGTARITDTDDGRWDRDARFDRAVGPMQFIPGTWLAVAADGDGDGLRNPQDMADAATSAGVYLCSGGGNLRAPRGAYRAVLRYNHSDDYARTVLSIADAYRSGVEVLPVGALPAARPASGSGTATPAGSGFAWTGDEPGPDRSTSSRPTPASTTTTHTGAPASSPTTGTPKPEPSPATRAVPVPTASLPVAPRVPAGPTTPTPTALSVNDLLALPHLPPLPGDPSTMVRVLSPTTGQTVCILGEEIVSCPSALG